MSTPLFDEKEDWTVEKLDATYAEIEKIALEELKLDLFPNQIEIIDSEKMLDAYSSHAMPVFYRHWSLGKSFLSNQRNYSAGRMGLAYEVVINCVNIDSLVDCKVRGRVPIKDLRAGDQIWNGRTYVQVKAVHPAARKKARRFILANGNEITATPDHRFPVASLKGLVDKKVSSIRPGDFLLGAERYASREIEADLGDFDYTPPLSGFGEKFIHAPFCEIPGFMNPDFAELMGIVIGNGTVAHTARKGFEVAVGWDNPGYADHVVDLIRRVFKFEANSRGLPSQKYPNESNVVITVMCNEIKEFLDFCGIKKGMTHQDKRVPWSIWQSSRVSQMGFLRGLFDTDGCVGTSKGKVTSVAFSCYNHELSLDVLRLLALNGFAASLKRIKNGAGQISSINLVGPSKRDFASRISLVSVKKDERLQRMLQVNKQVANDSSAASRLPSFLSKIYPGLPLRRSDFLSRADLRPEDVWLSDFRSLEVVAILDAGPLDVVDITVESDDHYFVANGILTHNCNPCISYLQESNDMTMQALVIAHAAFGHNAVFKGNCEFQKWTSPDSILDELNFAKVFISRCEERFGVKTVEEVLDACHALMDHGVDTHKRPTRSWKQKEERAERASNRRHEDYNLLWEKTVAKKPTEDHEAARFRGELEQPEENILYFIEKNAPGLPQWKREIIRIVRRTAQYFYPQMQTKVLNEGFATFTHHYCMHRLYEKGLITEGALFGFIQSHTNVIMQPEFDDPRYSGMNPYALGFSIFRDIRRACESPTEEDARWLPHLKGVHWLDAVKEAMANYNDSGFIGQFLSPKVIRDFKLFSLRDKPAESDYKVEAIHDEAGYERVRALLSERHTRSARVPNIQVVQADLGGSRELILKHFPYRGRPLETESLSEVMSHASALWGHPVVLK